MRVLRTPDRMSLELTHDESDKLRLALRRAIFEDIPQERQRDVLDFAALLLELLDAEAARGV